VAQYPVNQLHPLGGSISARVFQNDRVGVEENLYWSVHIDFAPVEFAGESDQASLTAEWFVLPIRDWRDLTGRIVQGEQETIEASFYVFEHDLASWTRVAFGRRDGRLFDVSVDLQVQLIGLDSSWEGDGPSRQDAAIHARIALPYDGFLIDWNHLAGQPENREKALAIARNYADLRCYKDIDVQSSTFVFAPLDEL
jgi:hypothetical protein